MAEKAKTKKIYIVYLIIILSAASGLRAETVGLDTHNYLNIFDLIINDHERYIYGIESGFIFFSKLILKIIPNAQFLLFFYSFIIYALIYLRLWELRDKIDIKWSSLCFFCLYYFLSFNIVRQLLAVAIIFWATRFIEKNKMINYIFFVLIAAQIHQSAYLSIILLLFNCIYWKEMNSSKRLLFLAIICFSPIAAMLSIEKAERYTNYFVNTSINIGFMMFVKLLLILLFSLLLHNIVKESPQHLKNFYYFVSIVFAMGIFLNSLGYIFKYMERISLYFYIFEVFYVGMIIKLIGEKNKNITKTIFLFLYLYYFVSALLGNGQGQIPYVVFFMR